MAWDWLRALTSAASSRRSNSRRVMSPVSASWRAWRSSSRAWSRLPAARSDLLLQQVEALRHLSDFVARMHRHRHHVDARVSGVQVAASEREQRVREVGHCAFCHAGGRVRDLHHGMGEDSGQYQADADAQDGDCDEDVLQDADERTGLIGQAGNGKQVAGAVEYEHQQHRAGELDVQRIGYAGQTLRVVDR